LGSASETTLIGRCATRFVRAVGWPVSGVVRQRNSRSLWLFAALTTALMLAPGLFGLAQNASKPQPGSPAEHDSTEEHLGRGYAALKNDRFEEAAGEFRAALALDPSLVLRARFPLAMTLFELHQPEEARREFEAVRREVGDHPNIMYYLGRLDFTDGKFDEAIQKLTVAAAKPPFPDTDYYLAFAYLKRGDKASAEKWFLKAAELDPQDPSVQYQLGRLYTDLGRREEAQKAFALSQALRRREEEKSQLGLDCNRKLAEGSVQAARSECEQLFDPNDPEKLAMLGTIYGQHGFYEEAGPPLRRAAELMPNSPQMQYNLALNYFRLKQFQEARIPLAKATIRWPDLFQLNALYGAVLFNLDDQQTAYAVLRHAHELNPQDAGSRDLLYRVSLLLAQRSSTAKQFSVSLQYLEEAAELRPMDTEPHRLMVGLFDAMGEKARAAEERKEVERLSVVAQSHANTQ
jgi:tetratricopeptide (TPR) repeat protein